MGKVGRIQFAVTCHPLLGFTLHETKNFQKKGQKKRKEKRLCHAGRAIGIVKVVVKIKGKVS